MHFSVFIFTSLQLQFFKRYDDAELGLLEKFTAIKGAIHSAMCDSIDTRKVLEKMRSVITMVNTYVMEKKQSGQQPNGHLLMNCANYLRELLSVFGATPDQARFELFTRER